MRTVTVTRRSRTLGVQFKTSCPRLAEHIWGPCGPSESGLTPSGALKSLAAERRRNGAGRTEARLYVSGHLVGGTTYGIGNEWLALGDLDGSIVDSVELLID